MSVISKVRQFIDYVETEERKSSNVLRRRIANGEEVAADDVRDICPTQQEIDVLEGQVNRLKDIRFLVSLAKNEAEARKEQQKASANLAEYYERKRPTEKPPKQEYAALKKASRI